MSEDAYIDALLTQPRFRAIELVAREGGATLNEIAEATGWERHTARGFLSRLGNSGNPIQRLDGHYQFESLGVSSW
jgi:hypothetical protein